MSRREPVRTGSYVAGMVLTSVVLTAGVLAAGLSHLLLWITLAPGVFGVVEALTERRGDAR